MKKIPIIFIAFVFSYYNSIAQPPHQREVLLKKIEVAKEDSLKANLYFQLANEYLKDNPLEAERFCLLGKKLSYKLNYKPGIQEQYTVFSNIQKYKGNFDSSLLINQQALAYALQNSDSVEIGRTTLNVGVGYQLANDYENAVQYIEKAKDIFTRNNLHQYDGATLSLLQYVYQTMHQYRKGVNSGLQGIKILEQTTDTTVLMQLYNNIGLNYIQLHLYDSAKYFLNKASVLADKTGEVAIQISTKLNYALISLKQLHTDSIQHYAATALQLAQKSQIPEYEGLAHYGMAYYHLQKKQYQQSQLAADTALQLASRFNMRELKQKVFALLSSLYYAKQDSKQGYFYFNQYELLSDSLLNESVTNNTISIEKKYETERKEAKIKLQQVQLLQSSSLNNFLIASAIALLFMLGLGYYTYRSRQKLQQAKIDELETEKKLTATEAVLKGEEQERSRLAKDLHDGLGGMLSGIKHSLSSMKENYIMTSDNVQTLERSIDMLNSSIIEMRRVAHNMMPEILVKYGLNTALQEYCNEIGRSGVIKVNYQSLGMNDISIEQTTAVTIYRIVQELTANAVKHGEAKNLLVQAHLSTQEKLIAITVEDDGKGFDIASLKQASGIGWNNIQNRVDFLKGRIDITSKAGMGTSVMIEIDI